MFHVSLSRSGIFERVTQVPVSFGTMKNTHINELEPDISIERNKGKAYIVFRVVPLLDSEMKKELLPAITVRHRITPGAATTLENCFRSSPPHLTPFAIAV